MMPVIIISKQGGAGCPVSCYNTDQHVDTVVELHQDVPSKNVSMSVKVVRINLSGQLHGFISLIYKNIVLLLMRITLNIICYEEILLYRIDVADGIRDILCSDNPEC